MDATGEAVEEPVGGARPTSPTQIPPTGWKDILLRTWSEISEDRVTLVAAGVTYYLLSLFPTLTAFVSIYGPFTDSATVAHQIEMMAGYVPAGFASIIKHQLTALTQQGNAALGCGFVVSFTLAVWSASNGVKTMFEAMNIAYDEKETRNFFVLNCLALLVMIGTLILGIVMVTVVLVIPDYARRCLPSMPKPGWPQQFPRCRRSPPAYRTDYGKSPSWHRA